MKLFGWMLIREQDYKEMEGQLKELNSDWNIAFNVMARLKEDADRKSDLRTSY